VHRKKIDEAEEILRISAWSRSNRKTVADLGRKVRNGQGDPLGHVTDKGEL
jgi:hypothetical protein